MAEQCIGTGLSVGQARYNLCRLWILPPTYTNSFGLCRHSLLFRSRSYLGKHRDAVLPQGPSLLRQEREPHDEKLLRCVRSEQQKTGAASATEYTRCSGHWMALEILGGPSQPASTKNQRRSVLCDRV